MGFYDIGTRVYEIDERVYGMVYRRSGCSRFTIVHRLLMRNQCKVVCYEISTKPWSPSIWHLLVRLGPTSPALNYEEADKESNEAFLLLCRVIRLESLLHFDNETYR